jgi:lipoprotein-anchoring transpeptidase ErfK/SrfK
MGPRPSRRSFAALLAGLVLLEVLAAGASPGSIRAAPMAEAPRAAGPLAPAPAERPLAARLAAGSNAPRTSPTTFLLVRVERAMPVTARPGGRRTIGSLPAASRFYGVPTVAWVRRTSPDGRFGLVDLPYVAEHRSGWIRLRGLARSWTPVRVVADLSERRLLVWRGDRVVLRAPAAIGAPGSPTPTGRYFVTDRIAFPGGGSLGTFAFGISGIQPNLPAGWAGGDQLAIHGTNAPSSIGRAASAGCLRVAERILDRLKPLLRLGTPVVVRA